MTQDEYIEELQKRFENNFNIEKDVVLFGERIDIHAKFINIIERTFITKKDVIDRYGNYEHCFIKKVESVTEAEIAAFEQFLEKVVNEYVNPSSEHMSTYVTGVIVGSSINDDAKRRIKGHRYSKAYLFYLKGWCDIRLVGVGLNDNEVITNKTGKHVKKVYQITP